MHASTPCTTIRLLARIDYAALKRHTYSGRWRRTLELPVRQFQANGNFVVIRRRGEQFVTKYLHLSKFARNIKKGRKSSKDKPSVTLDRRDGLPALTYTKEFLVNGGAPKPQNGQAARVEPVGATQMANFKQALTQTSFYSITSLIRWAPPSDDYRKRFCCWLYDRHKCRRSGLGPDPNPRSSRRRRWSARDGGSDSGRNAADTDGTAKCATWSAASPIHRMLSSLVHATVGSVTLSASPFGNGSLGST